MFGCLYCRGWPSKIGGRVTDVGSRAIAEAVLPRGQRHRRCNQPLRLGADSTEYYLGQGSMDLLEDDVGDSVHRPSPICFHLAARRGLAPIAAIHPVHLRIDRRFLSG